MLHHLLLFLLLPPVLPLLVLALVVVLGLGAPARAQRSVLAPLRLRFSCGCSGSGLSVYGCPAVRLSGSPALRLCAAMALALLLASSLALAAAAAAAAAPPPKLPFWTAPKPDGSRLQGYSKVAGNLTDFVVYKPMTESDGMYNHAAMIMYHQGVITVSWCAAGLAAACPATSRRCLRCRAQEERAALGGHARPARALLAVGRRRDLVQGRAALPEHGHRRDHICAVRRPLRRTQRPALRLRQPRRHRRR